MRLFLNLHKCGVGDDVGAREDATSVDHDARAGAALEGTNLPGAVVVGALCGREDFYDLRIRHGPETTGK